MRALLINPWVYDFACYDLFSKPIGFLQIARSLIEAGIEVEYIDCLDRFHPALRPFVKGRNFLSRDSGCGNYYSEPAEKPLLFRQIPRKYKRYGLPERLFAELLSGVRTPDVVMVTSGMTYWYQGVFEAVDLLKKHFPRTPVVLGGIYATLCHKHACARSGADIVFRGGGLREIGVVISRLLGTDIPLGGRKTLPAYHLYRGLPYISLRTSSGCPFRCSYCGWYGVDPVFMQRDPEEVCFEIEHFYRAMNIRNFAFYDEALFYNPEGHIVPILEKLLAEGLRVRFYTPNGLHARFITAELAGLLKRSAFIQPRLGYESADRVRQRMTGGKVDSRDLKQALTFLKAAGYASREIGVYLLAGLPGQNYTEIEASIRFAHELGVRVYLEEYSPVPGTPDYARSGLPEDADPLMHNNSALPLYSPGRYHDFQLLKDLNHRLNLLHRVHG